MQIIQVINVCRPAQIIHLIMGINKNAYNHVPRIGLLIIQQDYVFNHLIALEILMEILQVNNVFLIAHLIIIKILEIKLKCVLKHAKMDYMRMIPLNLVYQNALCQIKLMVITKPINVLKYALLDNLLKMIQECVCLSAQITVTLIKMWEFVFKFALLHLICMEIPLLNNVFKYVLKIQIYMAKILQECVNRHALFLNLRLLIN